MGRAVSKATDPYTIPTNSAPSVTLEKDATTRMYLPHAKLTEMADRALRAFRLRRYRYYSRKPGRPHVPWISIVTRSYKNEHLLQRNIAITQHMLDPCFEHVILHDEQGLGMMTAETALYAFRHKFEGQYICHLDDDDYLSNLHFVGDMARLIKEHHPGLIIYRVQREDGTAFPRVWETFPVEGDITTSNVLFRRDIYQNAAVTCALSQPHAGDYACIYNALIFCQREKLPILWVDQCYMFITLHGSPLNSVQPISAQVEDPSFYVTVVLQGDLVDRLFQLAAAYVYSRQCGKILVLTEENTEPMFAWVRRLDRAVAWNVLTDTLRPGRLPVMAHHVRMEGMFRSMALERYREDLQHLFFREFNRSMEVPFDPAQTVCIDLSSMDKEYYRRAIDSIRPAPVQWLAIEASGPIVGIPCVSIANHPQAEQIYLMSLCRHHILSGSPLHWWGAFLSRSNVICDGTGLETLKEWKVV